jgi:hypothetical protein
MSTAVVTTEHGQHKHREHINHTEGSEHSDTEHSAHTEGDPDPAHTCAYQKSSNPVGLMLKAVGRGARLEQASRVAVPRIHMEHLCCVLAVDRTWT